LDYAAVAQRIRPNPIQSQFGQNDAVIRVYDATGNMIATHEHKRYFKEW
jgi:hypothetical protein